MLTAPPANTTMMVFMSQRSKLEKRRSFLMELKKRNGDAKGVKTLLRKASQAELDVLHRILVMICQRTLCVRRKIDLERKLKAMKMWKRVACSFVKMDRKIGPQLKSILIRLAPVMPQIASIGLHALRNTAKPAAALPPAASVEKASVEEATGEVAEPQTAPPSSEAAT